MSFWPLFHMRETIAEKKALHRPVTTEPGLEGVGGGGGEWWTAI